MNFTPDPLPALHHACYLLVALTWLVAAGSVWRSIPFKRPVLKAVVGSGVIATTFCLILCGWMIANMIRITEIAAQKIPSTSYAGTAEAETTDIRIEVLDHQNIRVNGEVMPATDLEAHLPEIRRKVPQDPLVEISAPDDASYKAIEQMLDVLSKSGLHRVTFQAREQH